MGINRRELLGAVVVFPLFGKVVARTQLGPRDTDDRRWDEWLDDHLDVRDVEESSER